MNGGLDVAPFISLFSVGWVGGGKWLAMGLGPAIACLAVLGIPLSGCPWLYVKATFFEFFVSLGKS